MHGMSWFREKQNFKAEAGRNGASAKKTGRRGRDLVLPVPPGTIVRGEPDGEVLADLTEAGDELVVARGGRGGRGNARFATARLQAPRVAERGEPGDRRKLHLELRLLAEIGIVGAPNAGKSTLLAALTEARPKIGDYPFTTLQPNLGVAEVDGRRVVLADIPGLIDGAHRGAGLGDQFLRHIRRTRSLIHLLDGTAEDPLRDMDSINSELAAYDPALARKSQIVVVNKMDREEALARWPEWQTELERRGLRPLAISARDRSGVEALLRAAARAAEASQPEPGKKSSRSIVHRRQVACCRPRSRRAWRVSGQSGAGCGHDLLGA
jgi:GTP-binding protein